MNWRERLIQSLAAENGRLPLIQNVPTLLVTWPEEDFTLLGLKKEKGAWKTEFNSLEVLRRFLSTLGVEVLWITSLTINGNKIRLHKKYFQSLLMEVTTGRILHATLWSNTCEQRTQPYDGLINGSDTKH